MSEINQKIEDLSEKYKTQIIGFSMDNERYKMHARITDSIKKQVLDQYLKADNLNQNPIALVPQLQNFLYQLDTSKIKTNEGIKQNLQLLLTQLQSMRTGYWKNR